MTESSTQTIHPGTSVEVRSTLDGSWTDGFEVIDLTDRGYRLRRQAEGQELPAPVRVENVRRVRKRETWWV